VVHLGVVSQNENHRDAECHLGAIPFGDRQRIGVETHIHPDSMVNDCDIMGMKVLTWTASAVTLKSIWFAWVEADSSAVS
jgi:hypothetical protein